MADTSQNLDVSTVLKHLQAIFEQEGLADLKITFPYTPAPGSWQAALQGGGLTGFSDWLLRDSATALTKQGAQKASQDAAGKKEPTPSTSSPNQAPSGQPKDAAPSPQSTLALDLAEAARHVGQVFRSMLLGQSPQQAAQPTAKQESQSIVPAVTSETLTAFNDMLHKLIPGKDGQGPAQLPASGKPSAVQPTPPPPSATKDSAADWRYWADKGLTSLNQFLNQGIKSISGKDAQPSTQERPTKSSVPAADSTPVPKAQTKKKSGDASEDTGDDDKSPKAKSDDDKDDADDESDTDSSDSTSDDSSSDSDANDSGSDEDESAASDDDSSDAYDGEREHLLDVGEG